MFGKIEEVAVIILVILLLFGHKRIPELAKSISRSVKEVRKGFSSSDSSEEGQSTAKENSES